MTVKQVVRKPKRPGPPARVCGPVLGGGRTVRPHQSGSVVPPGNHALQSFNSSPPLPFPRHFPSPVLFPTPNLTSLSLRTFSNTSTSMHRGTTRGLAFSAPAAHRALSAYSPPTLAVYPHTSQVGPEFVWSVESGGLHFGGSFFGGIRKLTRAEVRRQCFRASGAGVSCTTVPCPVQSFPISRRVLTVGRLNALSRARGRLYPDCGPEHIPRRPACGPHVSPSRPLFVLSYPSTVRQSAVAVCSSISGKNKFGHQ